MTKEGKILILLIILCLAGAGYFIFKNNDSEPTAGEQYNIVGGDRDEHDCLGSAGYSWCEAKQKCLRVFEEFCPDSAVELAGLIKEASGINLALAGEKNFNWIVEQDSVMANYEISGVSYLAEGVKMEEYNKIEEYMNTAYEIDNYNLASGVEGGLRGYKSGYMACALNFRHAEVTENSLGISEPVGDNLVVTLDCGYFNPNDVPELILSRTIAELLAQKYQKSVDEVDIKITKKDDTHAAGSVTFGAGGPGEGGMFLAVKEDNNWKVVFDGNGSIDCDKMRNEYNFSDEILQPNFCD